MDPLHLAPAYWPFPSGLWKVFLPAHPATLPGYATRTPGHVAPSTDTFPRKENSTKPTPQAFALCQGFMSWPPQGWSSPGPHEAPKLCAGASESIRPFRAPTLCKGRLCFCNQPCTYLCQAPPCLLVSAAHHSRLVSSEEWLVCFFSRGHYLVAVHGTHHS